MIDSENEIIMKKKALVLTYHVKNCTRLGGFHYFINFLTRAGYYVDWVTLTVSSSWIIKNNDRENPKNFFEILRRSGQEQEMAPGRFLCGKIVF